MLDCVKSLSANALPKVHGLAAGRTKREDVDYERSGDRRFVHCPQHPFIHTKELVFWSVCLDAIGNRESQRAGEAKCDMSDKRTSVTKGRERTN